MRVLIAFFLLFSVAQVYSAFVIPCSGWPLYKQCDASWGNDMLGHSSVTICRAGCAMSSVAMALRRFNVPLNGAASTPSHLSILSYSQELLTTGSNLMAVTPLET